MEQIIDYKRPISVSLPQSIIEQLDKQRGRLPRSVFILQILESKIQKEKKHA